MDFRNYFLAAFSFWSYLLITINCIGKSTQQMKEYILDDPKLCSEITNRKITEPTFLITPGASRIHYIDWELPLICKFRARKVDRNGGIVAVIQSLNLRKNMTTGACIDYIQFTALKGPSSDKHCGVLNARDIMNAEKYEALPKYYPFSYGNSFIDVNGEMDVTVYIAKPALRQEERTHFEIVFTSYEDCLRPPSNNLQLFECGKDSNTLKICISKRFFRDGYINCPHYGCLDEDGCMEKMKTDTSSVGNRVIVGSISTLGILFAVFILLIWAFKKHKLFCWAEPFAHPSATPRDYMLDEHEQTPAAIPCTVSRDTPAPVSQEEAKDLPPSYDSLFPQR